MKSACVDVLSIILLQDVSHVYHGLWWHV